MRYGEYYEKPISFNPTNIKETLKLYKILESQCTKQLRDCPDSAVFEERRHYRRAIRVIEKKFNNNLRNIMKDNLLLLTDAYKQTHYRMLPPDTKYVYSYLESRGVSDKGVPAETLMYGLQILLHRLQGSVFDMQDVEEARVVCKSVFGMDIFNYQGWKDLYNKHHGSLPLRIEAVPEGTVVPSHNVLVTVENTDPQFPWLVNFFETILLNGTWYPITVATTSYGIKKLVRKWAEKTGGSMNVNFHLNDFGFRGVSSIESAGIGGSAHLINFLGSDTLYGITYAKKFYNAIDPIGLSVPASEHSATITWGEGNEAEAYKHFMTQYPEGIISIVADSYDLMNAINNIFGGELKDLVINRNGKTVIRPDSGWPPIVSVQVAKALYKIFGGETNDKGYITLNPKVGIIYGDFIKYGMIDDILTAMAEAGFSTDNIVFGMGGALLQQVNRDTFKFAFKTSAIQRGNEDWLAVSKHPATDPGKNSKAGRFQLLKENDKFITVPYSEMKQDKDLLKTVFLNGVITKRYTFDEVRKTSEQYL